MFSTTLFQTHYEALDDILPTLTPTQVQDLVQYLLSIDGSTTPITAPSGPSVNGGPICNYTP